MTNEIVETVYDEQGNEIDFITRPRIPHFRHTRKCCPHCIGITAHVLTGKSWRYGKLYACLLCRNEHPA